MTKKTGKFWLFQETLTFYWGFFNPVTASRFFSLSAAKVNCVLDPGWTNRLGNYYVPCLQQLHMQWLAHCIKSVTLCTSISFLIWKWYWWNIEVQWWSENAFHSFLTSVTYRHCKHLNSGRVLVKACAKYVAISKNLTSSAVAEVTNCSPHSLRDKLIQANMLQIMRHTTYWLWTTLSLAENKMKYIWNGYHDSKQTTREYC